MKGVCRVSCNYNERIAQVVEGVLNGVGIEGVVNIVEADSGQTGFKMLNGLVV